MSTGNPIWDVHNQLWALLEDASNVATLKTAGKHFTDLVKDSVNSRLQHTSDTRRDIVPQAESTAHFPQVQILHAKTKPKEWAASNADVLAIQWEVLVRTGDQRFTEIMDLEWAIYRQLNNWRTGTNNLLTSVTWSGENPVKRFDILSSDESLFDERQNKNMRGWSAKWVGHTELWFNHATLIA